MITTTAPEANTGNGHAPAENINYLNNEYGIKSWLLTLDHKRIGLLYLITTTMFFVIGGIFASLRAICWRLIRITRCSPCTAWR
jgi:cytochrome c oxidase subunit 1